MRHFPLEHALDRSGQSELYASLLAKLAAQETYGSHLSRAIVDFVSADFESRYEVMMRFLYSMASSDCLSICDTVAAAPSVALGAAIATTDQLSDMSTSSPVASTDMDSSSSSSSPVSADSSPESSSSMSSSSSSPSPASNTGAFSLSSTSLPAPAPTSAQHRYKGLVEMLLRNIEEKHKSADPAFFSRFLLDLPILTPEALDRVQRYCHDADQRLIASGLTALRDLILERPPFRRQAMLLLLSYTCDPTSALATAAVNVVSNKLFPHTFLRQQIEDFALASLRRALEPWVDEVALAQSVPVDDAEAELGQDYEDEEDGGEVYEMVTTFAPSTNAPPATAAAPAPAAKTEAISPAAPPSGQSGAAPTLTAAPPASTTPSTSPAGRTSIIAFSSCILTVNLSHQKPLPPSLSRCKKTNLQQQAVKVSQPQRFLKRSANCWKNYRRSKRSYASDKPKQNRRLLRSAIPTLLIVK